MRRFPPLSVRAGHFPVLPLRASLRPARPSDIWFKPALSVVAALAVPDLVLLALGRVDLILYTMAGSLCALYAHNRPYRARARVLAGVVVGMAATVGVALTAASLTRNALVLVAVGSLMAAVQKLLCDTRRIGPPAQVIFVFVGSAALFVPQHLAQVPGHVALTVAAGAWAWCVGMAPALVRPDGPERRAVAAALRAAAALADAHRPATGVREGAPGAPDGSAGPTHPCRCDGSGDGRNDCRRLRASTAAALHAARHALLTSGSRPAVRRPLELLLVRAEVALAAPAGANPDVLRSLVAALRGRGPLPTPVTSAGLAASSARGSLPSGDPWAAEILGAEAERRSPGPRLRDALSPASPLLPVALRTFVGCALAGSGSLALGVGRPYWALVTAASLYQANLAHTWSRGLQRLVGNLVGVLVFAALVPVAGLGPGARIVCCLLCAFGAEALISRSYWLGTVCVTPMALLVTEFVRAQPPGQLIADRAIDTAIGAGVGLLAAVAVTNRRVGDTVRRALAGLERANEEAGSALSEPVVDPAGLRSARRGLATALVDLRTAADAAAGEWWPRDVPDERVLAAEQAGHRTLAAIVERQGLLTLEDAPG
ncbi:FUSC family protein [Actinacidiphila acidipaludis]|uniref:FUSC family protein n=1 Tax=Actinacidiphila acidipaludis TaxID=2873382 RepID=A0ABS7PZM4_9ACTN|nr:FUSC family protein [Streptomyces acidipaludis]MBY8876342.1 FUSC family protein [Streptomyces acidipaludis]